MLTNGVEVAGLRDERRAGHFWVDNEVADCFQPIIGPDAVWVYCRIARYAYGGAWITSPNARRDDKRVSLREMAEWTGKSVDTVWRCLQMLEHVGLVRSVQSGARAKACYALADVKELITSQGGAYDRNFGSFNLPAARVLELKLEIGELRKRLQRKQSVALSDTAPRPVFSAPVADCDSSVALSDASVAPYAGASITKNCKTEKQTPPIPPQAGGEAGRVVSIAAAERARDAADLADGPAVELTADQLEQLARISKDELREQYRRWMIDENRAAAEKAAQAGEAARVERARDEALELAVPTAEAAIAWVMRECGFVEDRPGRGISRVISAVLAGEYLKGEPWHRAASRMVAAWGRWLENRHLMRVSYGAKAFFREGLWRNERAWPWDERRLGMHREAAAGVR